jgi:hypothetical protein
VRTADTRTYTLNPALQVPKKPSLVECPDLKEYLYSLSPNHWANVATMKRYVSNLLVPYLMKARMLGACNAFDCGQLHLSVGWLAESTI